jgi:hypothetical protein
MSQSLVIAAHPDDELLGLSRQLINGEISDVIYVLAAAPDAGMLHRLKEADDCAKHFDFDVHVASAAMAPSSQFKHLDRIYLPAPTDGHAEHQMALTWGLKHFGPRPHLMEYSIEKAAPYVVPLKPSEVQQKRAWFRQHYDSQTTELQDPKYFLFEGSAPFGVPSITVSFKQPGFHFWKEAPDEVSFLRSPHRHLFGVKVTLRDLAHHDRNQEFFLVQQWAMEEFESILRAAEINGASCEMMARDLAIAVRIRYGCKVRVSVDEDGENSAEVSL